MVFRKYPPGHFESAECVPRDLKRGGRLAADVLAVLRIHQLGKVLRLSLLTH